MNIFGSIWWRWANNVKPMWSNSGLILNTNRWILVLVQFDDKRMWNPGKLKEEHPAEMDCSLSHPWLSHWQRKLFESISPLNISPLVISPWTISLATFIVWNYFTFYITLYLTGNVILRSDWNYLTLYLTVKVIERVSHSLLLCLFPLSLPLLLFLFLTFNFWFLTFNFQLPFTF